jgi:hypothetical protein
MKFGNKHGTAADNNDMSIDECKKWQSDWNVANPEYVPRDSGKVRKGRVTKLFETPPFTAF